MFANTFHLLRIIAKNMEAGGLKLKIASALSKDLPNEFMTNIENVSHFRNSDIVLLDMKTVNRDLLVKLSEELSDASLLMVLDGMINVHLWPEFGKELGVKGYTRSLIPVDNGIALFIRRGYGSGFFKKSIEVYRDSFIHGPGPVDYNTAYVLYSFAKFVTARRKGIIIEVGTGRGFSTLWLAHAAKETGSHVISIDNKCDRVDYARNALKALDLEKYTEIICADARSYVHGDKDIVYVFIDGKKDEYHQYLEALEPYLQPGALLLAHNTLSDAHLIKPYIEKVYSKPYKSATIATDPKGLTISVYTPQ